MKPLLSSPLLSSPLLSSPLLSVAIAVLSLFPTATAAQDWSGAYGVLGVADVGGYREDFNGAFSLGTLGNEGMQTNLSLGYNFQNGNWVFGGELGYSPADVAFEGISQNYLDGMIDLKGRVGYDSGKLLWYGTIGWARSSFVDNVLLPEPEPTDGFSFGLGVDAFVTDRMFVGLELQQRNLRIDEGDIGGFPNTSIDFNVRTIGLRVGLKF